jgi:hypothetical protein
MKKEKPSTPYRKLQKSEGTSRNFEILRIERKDEWNTRVVPVYHRRIYETYRTGSSKSYRCHLDFTIFHFGSHTG